MIEFALIDGRLETVEEMPLLLELRASAESGDWTFLPLVTDGANAYAFDAVGVRGSLRWTEANETRADYALSFTSDQPVRLRLAVSAKGGAKAFHVIPACLLGDNNHALVRPKEFPTLHAPVADNPAASPLWEFRADRAACPVSLICTAAGVAGLSIAPYAELDRSRERQRVEDQLAGARRPGGTDADDATGSDGFIRNGVFAALPATAGVSLGYGNDPLTFVNKQHFGPPTAHRSRGAQAGGSFYQLPGADRPAVHYVVRDLYRRLREKPAHRRSADEAVRALTESFAEVNWSEEFGNYSNLACRVPTEPVLKAWRPVSEIGWTGGGVFAWPLLRAAARLPDVALPKTAEQILDEIIGTWNERTGFFNDVAGPSLVGVPGQGGVIKTGEINGWWSGFMPHTMNRHCAYTNGHATYYLLKCARWVHNRGGDATAWEDAALKVCDAVIEQQRGDGAFGYLFSAQTRKVVDWDGFAGCWFAAALPFAYEVTQNDFYLKAARRAVRHYGYAVAALNCYGTPMDTYKSVDQEGILAFVQATRWLHEVTGEEEWLNHLRAGADYELLWRYAYRARPEYAPLKGTDWNSCGGSVTSVSNPHIHPMGLVITEPLHYLARVTGDAYYRDRADDGVAWALQTLELYPEVSGYGRYGVMTERYCPSDGLVIETFADTGAPSSMWWSYNAWATANVLEGLLDTLEDVGRDR